MKLLKPPNGCECNCGLVMTPSHTLSHGDTSVSIYMSPFPSVDIRMFTPAWMLSGLPCLNHVIYVQKTTEQFKTTFSPDSCFIIFLHSNFEPH